MDWESNSLNQAESNLSQICAEGNKSDSGIQVRIEQVEKYISIIYINAKRAEGLMRA